MKAIIQERYGSPDVLRLEEMNTPAPKGTELLVRVCASSVNAGDWHMMRADPFIVRFFGGFIKPKNKTLGADVAGVVEAVGMEVTKFSVGDEVFGDVSQHGMGAFAEYACAPENAFAPKPVGISFEEAAAVPSAAATALTGLRDSGMIRPGQKVLINGASGGVGMYAVQIAKFFDTEVTGVCSAKNIEMVRSLGADHVIDYKQEDFTRSGKQYDLILAANGYHPLAHYKRSLTPTGTYVMSGGAPKQMWAAMLLGPLHSKKGGKQIRFFVNSADQKNLLFLKELMELGKLRPIIDRIYQLREVPDAIRYMEKVHPSGKLVISMEDKR